MKLWGPLKLVNLSLFTCSRQLLRPDYPLDYVHNRVRALDYYYLQPFTSRQS